MTESIIKTINLLCFWEDAIFLKSFINFIVTIVLEWYHLIYIITTKRDEVIYFTTYSEMLSVMFHYIYRTQN